MTDAATHRFADAKGRTWTFEVNTFTAYRLKRETEFDLLTLADSQASGASRLADDFYLLFDVMASLLQDQFERQAVDAEEFGRSMDESTTAEAVQALFRAFADFSRGPKARVFRAAMERAWKLAETQERQAAERLDQAARDGTLDRMIGDALAGETSSG